MDGLKITGAWTKAGVASCIRVQGATKHDDFLLDCGVLESDTLSAKFVLVTHGHIDHVGSCISHARAKALASGPSTYYVPPDISESLNEGKLAFQKMDNTIIPMNIVAISPGESVLVGSNLKVVVFETRHRVPSQGYAVYTINKGELLPELRNKTKEEIAALKRSGVKVISESTETLQLVYTGDTTFEGLMSPENAFLFRAPIFITELTYLDGERDKAIKYGHVHIDDIVENEDLFGEGGEDQAIVFVHLSAKYSLSRAVKLLRDQIPASMRAKVLVSLKSFGANEHLTRIDDSRWAQREATQAGWGWASSNRVSYDYNGSSSSGGGSGRMGSFSHGRGGGRQGSMGGRGYTGRSSSASATFSMTSRDRRNVKARPNSAGGASILSSSSTTSLNLGLANISTGDELQSAGQEKVIRPPNTFQFKRRK